VTSLCNRYKEVPEEARKGILVRALTVYVNSKLQEGDLYSVRDVLSEADKRGLLEGGLKDLKARVDALVEAQEKLTALELHINAVIELINRGAVDEQVLQGLRGTLSDARKAVEANRSLLPQQVFDTLSRLEAYAEDLVSYARLAIRFKSIADSVQQLTQEKVEDSSQAGALASRARELSKHVEGLLSDISRAQFRTSEYKSAAHKLWENARELGAFLAGAQVYYSSLERAVGLMEQLSSLVQGYGEGGKVLGNTSYWDRLYATIRDLMVTARNTVSLLSVNPYFKDPAGQLYNQVVAYLTELKRTFGENDFRWVDLFERAERDTGVKLGWSPPSYEELARESIRRFIELARRVPVVGEQIAKTLEWVLQASYLDDLLVRFQRAVELVDRYLSSFFKDLYERAVLAWRTGGYVTKAAAAVTQFVTGFLDNITIIIRPSAIKEYVSTIYTLIVGARRSLEEGGVKGLASYTADVLKQMFLGENLFYTLGAMLAVFAVGKALGKIPIPARYRAAIENILFADPVGLTVEFIGASAVRASFRTGIRQLAREGKVARAVEEGVVARVSAEIAESLAREKFGRLYERTVEYLRRAVRDAILNPGKVAQARRDLRELARRVGVEESLRVTAEAYRAYESLLREQQQAIRRLGEVKVAQVTLKPVEAVVEPRAVLERVSASASKAVASLRAVARRVDEASELFSRLEPFLAESRKSRVRELLEQARRALPEADLESLEKSLASYTTEVNLILRDLKDTLLDLSRFFESEDVRRLVGEEQASKLKSSLEGALAGLERGDYAKVREALESASKTARELSIKLRQRVGEADEMIARYSVFIDSSVYGEIRKHLELGERVAGSLEQLDVRLDGVRTKALLEAEQTLKDVLKGLGMVEEARRAVDRLEAVVRGRLQQLLREAGLVEEADRLAKAKPEELLDALSQSLARLAVSIEERVIRASENALKALDELLADERVKRLLNLANVAEVRAKLEARVTLGKALREELLKLSLELSETLGRYRLPRDLEVALAELRDKALREAVELSDLEKVTNVIARYAPELAGLVELEAVMRVLARAREFVGELRKNGFDEYRASVLEDTLGNVMKSLEEYAVRKGVEEAGVTRAVEVVTVAPELRVAFQTLLDAFRDYAPDLYERYRGSVERFIRLLESSEPDPKLLQAEAENLYSMLREAGGLPVMPSSLKKALMWLSDRVDELWVKMGDRERAMLKAVKDMADELKRDLDRVAEMPDGWWFLYTDISRIEYTPIVAPLDQLFRVRDLLRQTEKRWRARLGDLEVEVTRRIEVLPDGTLKISYRLEFPEGRFAEYRYVVRSAGRGVAHVYESMFYDPEIPRAVAVYESGLREHPLYRLGRELGERMRRGELFEELDPDFALLKRVAIRAVDGSLRELGRFISESLVRLLAVIGLAGRATLYPQVFETRAEGLAVGVVKATWLTTLALDKRSFVERLRSIADLEIPEVVKRRLEELGFTVVAITKTRIPIVLAIPVRPDIPIEEVKRWIILRLEDRKVPLPVIIVPEYGSIAVLPLVNIDIPGFNPEEALREAENVATETVSVETLTQEATVEEGAEEELPPPPQQARPRPRRRVSTRPPVRVSVEAERVPFIAIKRDVRGGVQYEVLVI